MSFSRPDNINPTYLASNSGYEPRRTNNFLLKIFLFDGGNRGALDPITLSVVELQMGQLVDSPLEIIGGNRSRYVAGKASGEALQLICLDYMDQNTLLLFWNWFKLVYDPSSDVVGYASNYKRDGKLEQYGPDMGTRGKIVWDIYGMYPSKISIPGPLSYESNDFAKIDVTIQCDYYNLISYT